MSDIRFCETGSLWRRWDLHVHPPGTKLNNAYGSVDDETWNKFMDLLETSDVQAFGITDYFSADTFFELQSRYQEKYSETKKQFFLNIEFRLSESISKDGTHPDFHVIFDNDTDKIDQDKIVRFLTNLETQSLDDASVRQRCSDLTSEADFMAATVTLDGMLEALNATFGDEKPYLLAFPANNNGLRSTDSSSPRKVSLADRIDRTCDLFFGKNENRDFLLGGDRYSEGVSDPKPVVSGSDAHSFDDLERLSGDVAGFASTWIKSDLTFLGLKQICHEPESRVFIGSEPDVMNRLNQDGTKFLGQLSINQIAGYDESNGQWFKEVSFPLNPELTAIIGNKGSGKSAIVDILGLLGESRQEGYFSFLTDDSKSKKFRQRGYAENFIASITWQTGKVLEKSLDESCDQNKPETVEYLPQNYFEQLTNEIEIEQFRNEIEDVVFSHVEETEKLGKSSFSELEEEKTQQSKVEISSLKRQLRELNFEIVELEKQSSPQFREQITAQIKAKEEELEALDTSKPKEVGKPDEESDEQKALTAEIGKLGGILASISEKGKSQTVNLTSHKSRLQKAVTVKERLVSLDAGFNEEIVQIIPALQELELDAATIVQHSLNTEALDQKVSEIQEQISIIETENGITFSLDTNFSQLSTIPDLKNAYHFVEEQISQLKEKLGTPQRKYQSYVDRLSAWTAKRNEILGDEEDPLVGTLNGLKKRLKGIDEDLATNLNNQYERRGEILNNIYSSKREFLQFYQNLKNSVDEHLDAVRTDGFGIEIQASFILNKDFQREFLNQIDQRKRGPFRNNADAIQKLNAFISETEWGDPVSILTFCNQILSEMRSDGLDLSDQTHNVKEFYDFLFSLDYLSSRYELRLGGKNLNELSPGEKGLLLLIFYLQLDRKNTPLIIDQPEDNLDNESIFRVLANCIREAKKRRQVVMVTHNPNLAVGSDAEQIIYVNLDKANNYKFSYETGSIENPQTNKRIVNVLEGSQPAFVKRRLKYGI